MGSRHRLIDFLVAAVIFLTNNFAEFFIVDRLIEGYMLITPTDAILTLSLFNSIYSGLSFRSDA